MQVLPKLGYLQKPREVSRLSNFASPDDIAQAASAHGCRSVAYTYNDPVIWAEYAIDTAAACRERDIRSVAVTAGYINREARTEFFGAMDAANIDLKAFTEEFYFQLTSSHLQPVLDTIEYVCNETDVWVELTNLVIPRANDQLDELSRMCDWIVENIGVDVPVHFTAFHPDFRMRDRGRTDHETLIAAFDLARAAGLRYAYVGNVHDVARQSTYCPSCGQCLIQRDWHQLGVYALDENRCRHCQTKISGHFESTPGTWGRRRQPIRITTNSATPNPASEKDSFMSTDAVTDDLLSESERAAVLAAASRYVCDAAHDRALHHSLPDEIGQKAINGVYVTLKRQGTLRGCCGLQGNPMHLSQALSHAAERTTKHDPRMAPITTSELPYLDLTVSILGPPRPIGASGKDRVEAIEIGRHGLRIQLGNNAGLLLPQVATEQGWDSRQFLDAVCRKAGLPAGSWLNDKVELLVFDGIDFSAPLSVDEEANSNSVEPAMIHHDQLDALVGWVQTNLTAIRSGATPNFYAHGIDDKSVLGVALQIESETHQQSLSWLQLVFRDGVPLQSTLLELTKQAAYALDLYQWQPDIIRLAVLSGAVHHGARDSSDLRGVNVHRRAIVTYDGTRTALQFDPGGDSQTLLDDALQSDTFRQTTQVYSFVCDCTASKLRLAIGPRAIASTTVRDPAVADRFYPIDDAPREQMIDQLLDGLVEIEKGAVATAMVPHAGLRFSGRIAADVWRRIELPETVVIIGPKHTTAGVDWAVAPHESWKLSATASLPGDVELAKSLAESVPGMQLDSAAHAGEHGIEVQLPILHRLSPQTKVVGVAMHGGQRGDLRQAAKAMANWIEGLQKPPLLVISSDMNHFAEDAENRRRDRLALEMLEANDPEGLLKVCGENSISMCGQVPAALVLMTLQELEKEVRYQEIAYATSGDVTGDTSRVVGYAGILW